MKRYLLFGSTECYYAEGGAHNLLGAGDDTNNLFEKVISKYPDQWYGETTYLDWWHIYDLKSEKIIMGSLSQPHPCDPLNSPSHKNVSKDCVFYKQKSEGGWIVPKF